MIVLKAILKVCLLIMLVQNCYAAEEGDYQSAQEFFSHYLDSYNANDAEGASQKYAESVTLTGVQAAPILSTPQGMKKILEGFLGRLKAQGVTRYEWETLQVRMLGKNTALASNIAARYKADGTLHDKAAATFIAGYGESGWKILVLNIHEPKNVLVLK